MIGIVCVSVCPIPLLLFLNQLYDLSTSIIACVWDMTIACKGLKFKVASQGQRLRLVQRGRSDLDEGSCLLTAKSGGRESEPCTHMSCRYLSRFMEEKS